MNIELPEMPKTVNGYLRGVISEHGACILLRPLDWMYKDSLSLVSAISFVNGGESLVNPYMQRLDLSTSQSLANLFLYFPDKIESDRDLRQFIAAMLVGCGLKYHYQWEVPPSELTVRCNGLTFSVFPTWEHALVDQLYRQAMSVGQGLRILELTLALIGSSTLGI